MSEPITFGSTEPIVVALEDSAGLPLTGASNVLAKVYRTNDGTFLDFADMTFKAGASVGTLTHAVTEIDAVRLAGLYSFDLATGDFTNASVDDIYEVRVTQTPKVDADNVPQTVQLRYTTAIADAVLDAAESDHVAPGTPGYALFLQRSAVSNGYAFTPGNPGIEVLLRDDDSPLLTFHVTDRGGNAVVSPVGAPARRTKGV